MPQFKDNNGREWTLRINANTLKRVREAIGVSIHDALSDGFAGLNKLTSDPVQLADALYAIVKEDAEKDKVTPEMFGAALGGDSLQMAMNALVGALIDFTPSKKAREQLAELWQKNQRQRDMMLEASGRMIDAIDPEKLAGIYRADLDAKLAELVKFQNGEVATPDATATDAK